ncbi:8130_t:CDS:2, partial [Entrophospora sp. SA101]
LEYTGQNLTEKDLKNLEIRDIMDLENNFFLEDNDKMDEDMDDDDSNELDYDTLGLYTLSSSPSTVGTRYNDRFLYLKWKVLHQIHSVRVPNAL